MDRIYNTGKSNSVSVFVGTEVEKTPAYGLKTLFLATNQLTLNEIIALAEEHAVDAVYYGANRVFQLHFKNQNTDIEKLCNMGYKVTVDYQHRLHTEVKKQFKNVWLHKNFIPFCSVILPDIIEDDNLYIKIDDADFDASNPGVWAWGIKDLCNWDNYTPWEDYTSDTPVKDFE